MPPNIIDNFHGEYHFLSNFYQSAVEYEGDIYPTVEHAFQAAKTFDPVEREKVRLATSPGGAKHIGRKVTLRPDWETVKYAIMEDLVRRKFAVPELAELLLDTGDADLIEGNTWRDTTWGCVKNPDGTWRGQNHLG